jgi:hypothetical protein
MADDEFAEIHLEPLSDRESKAAAARRMRKVHSHIDEVIRQAAQRGEFDDLPGAGKPIQGLGEEHDPDWWLKQLVERERITVLPPSIQLRKDDAELDDLMDRQHSENAARQVVEDFNGRVIAARYGIPVGPPLITMPRDVDEALADWRRRREERDAARRAELPAVPPRAPRRRWFRRRR